MNVCARNGEVTRREMCVCKSTARKSVRKVLIVIWEVSTASRRYARMEWDVMMMMLVVSQLVVISYST